jgi:hypothetical protein
MRPNGRLSRFLLGALGFCAGVFLIAALGDYLFNLLLTLLALGAIVRALEPLARKRGWGSEGRLTRYLNRPRLIEEEKRLYVGSRHGL